jgi:hypothetical protein
VNLAFKDSKKQFQKLPVHLFNHHMTRKNPPMELNVLERHCSLAVQNRQQDILEMAIAEPLAKIRGPILYVPL